MYYWFEESETTERERDSIETSKQIHEIAIRAHTENEIHELSNNENVCSLSVRRHCLQ